MGAHKGRTRCFPCCLGDGGRTRTADIATAVRECNGHDPIEYCRSVRIARARELLEGGELPQKQIAQSLGYKDVASFARVFRKAVGEAPGAYRKKFFRKGISPADFAAKDGSRQKEHIVEAGLQTG